LNHHKLFISADIIYRNSRPQFKSFCCQECSIHPRYCNKHSNS